MIAFLVLALAWFLTEAILEKRLLSRIEFGVASVVLALAMVLIFLKFLS